MLSLKIAPYEDEARGISKSKYLKKIEIEKNNSSSSPIKQYLQDFLLLLVVDKEPIELIRNTVESWSEQSLQPHLNIVILDCVRKLEIEAVINEYPDILNRCTYSNNARDLPPKYDQYFAIFSTVGTRFHPSLCYFLSLHINGSTCNSISWNSQECSLLSEDEVRINFIRRSEFNHFTLENSNYLNLCFGVRIFLIKEFYSESFSQIVHDKAYDFLKWISQNGAKWKHCPFYLSINYYEPYKQNKIKAIRSPKVPKLISIIMCFRDAATTTCKAIQSILNQSLQSSVELILINNQSNFESISIISNFLNASRINYKIYDYNHPFNHSRQNNLGISLAYGDVYILLNNDIELTSKDAIQELANHSLLDNVGTVGCRITSDDGLLISAGITARNNIGPDSNSPVEESRDNIFSNLRRETFANTFACVGISKNSYNAIGKLDEVNFPIGYNDVDFCLRASKLKFIHLYLGDIEIKHLTGSSRGSSDEIYQKVLIREIYPEIFKTSLFQLKLDKFLIINLTKIINKKDHPTLITSMLLKSKLFCKKFLNKLGSKLL